jgi:diguanylate cyclase (GGDEF)-like protein
VSALIDESVYQQGYLALQQAYETTVGSLSEKPEWIRLPPGIVLASNAIGEKAGEPMDGAFESLVRRRTQRVRLCERQLEEMNARVVTMAETDALTGLLNRKRFEEILDARSKDQERLSLLMIRLDGLSKPHGGMVHQIGEEALKALARVIHAHARPQDYCARLSENEFGLLMPDAGHFQAVDVRERIRSMLARTVIAPRTLNLGIQASIGIGSMPTDAVNPEDLLIQADRAMCTNQREASSVELSPASLLAN